MITMATDSIIIMMIVITSIQKLDRGLIQDQGKSLKDMIRDNLTHIEIQITKEIITTVIVETIKIETISIVIFNNRTNRKTTTKTEVPKALPLIIAITGISMIITRTISIKMKELTTNNRTEIISTILTTELTRITTKMHSTEIIEVTIRAIDKDQEVDQITKTDPDMMHKSLITWGTIKREILVIIIMTTKDQETSILMKIVTSLTIKSSIIKTIILIKSVVDHCLIEQQIQTNSNTKRDTKIIAQKSWMRIRETLEKRAKVERAFHLWEVMVQVRVTA
jgi:hypothetical protein